MATASDTNSCKMRAKWDWVESSATQTGKITDLREIYLLDDRRLSNVSGVEANYGFSLIERKNKVRGHGKSLVLRFESTPGKDFEILGWGLDVTGTSQ